MKHLHHLPLFAAGALVAGAFLTDAVPAPFAATTADAAGCSQCAAAAPATASKFAGTRWALNFPAGWLGVCQKDGKLCASLLWGGGNPSPINAVERDGKLILTREHKQRGGVRLETITAERTGDTLALEQVFTVAGKQTGKTRKLSATLIAPVPPRPDLSKLVFGEPEQLLAAGAALDDKWEVMNRRAYNGWTLKDGVLANNVVVNGKHVHGANLRTKSANYADFRLTAEVNMAPKGNSGIYLRGIYEIQMEDSFAQPLGNLHMGALYGRITPSQKAEKPAGEWQTVEILLVDRHVSVTLNGVKIIDNQPCLGVTGGAMSNDESKPGPIYLQGDHTNVSYRNMVITPVVGRK